jgi:hypothetical protein
LTDPARSLSAGKLNDGAPGDNTPFSGQSVHSLNIMTDPVEPDLNP